MHDMFIIHDYSDFQSRGYDKFEQHMVHRHKKHFWVNYCDYNALDNHCYKYSFILICKSLERTFAKQIDSQIKLIKPTNNKHEMIKNKPNHTMVSMNNLTWQ
eukprot:472231_1